MEAKSGASGPYAQEPQLLHFRQRLREKMADADMDTESLAMAIGQSRQVAWQWLSGVRLPSTVSLVRLSRALMVPADWLLGEGTEECGRRALRLAAARAKTHLNAEEQATGNDGDDSR